MFECHGQYGQYGQLFNDRIITYSDHLLFIVLHPSLITWSSDLQSQRHPVRMSSLLVRVGHGFMFGNMGQSWFYGLDALPITQPQCVINSNPRSHQLITSDISDCVKTAAQKKTTGECFCIAQSFKMHILVCIDVTKRPV